MLKWTLPISFAALIMATAWYVIACDSVGAAMLTIPFDATGFSGPVGVLPFVAVPWNDQIVVH